MRQSGRCLAIAGLGVLSLIASTGTAAAQQRTVQIPLSQQNASGIAGSVTLTDIGNNQTRVDVQITPATGDHPAHIHLGTCANLNPAPEIPLTNVQNGTSTTVVNQAIGTIQSTQRAINLHNSATDVATYVACGNIPLQGSQPPNAAPAAAAPAAAAPAPAAAAPAPAAAASQPAVSPARAAPAQVPVALPRTGGLPDPTRALFGLGLLLAATGLGLRRWAARR